MWEEWVYKPQKKNPWLFSIPALHFSCQLVGFGSVCWERTLKNLTEEDQVCGQIPALFLPTFSSFSNGIRPLIHAQRPSEGLACETESACKASSPPHSSLGGSLQLPPQWAALKAGTGHAFSTVFSIGSSLRASYDLILDDLSFKKKTLKP